ncbi:GIY-YIG nuclease family protein [Candidatus Kuenenbacteria bacterium]|nr:GIY-YIG nuclease family protein [Candidatus Kuenenbacteria bacterium]
MDKPGVYILKSLKNSAYYIGSSKNIDLRFTEHNNGRVKSTKGLSHGFWQYFVPHKILKKPDN